MLLNAQAQHMTIDVIQQGESYQDSSYYDIIEVKNEYWICGKYGTMKSINSTGEIGNINSPSNV
jgi:hypothetical protein